MSGLRGKDSEQLAVVVSKQMKKKIKELAKRDRRTMSQWVALLLEDTVEKRLGKG